MKVSLGRHINNMELLKITIFLATIVIQCEDTKGTCITDGETSGDKSPSLPDLSKSVLKYTLKQYQKIISKEQNENTFMSPYSIWSALTLIYLGARGSSSKEIESLLGLEGIDKSVLEEQNILFNNLVQSTGLNIFQVANKIAFDKQVTIKKCINDHVLFKDVESVDFAHDASNERIKLNKWVEKHTNRKIKNLLSSDAITSNSLMIMMNAVYFNGAWEHPFNENLVFDSPFESSIGEVNDVKLMILDDSSFDFEIGRNDEIGAEFIDIPYKNNTYSLLMILPDRENSNIENVVKKMTTELVSSMWDSLHFENVVLGVPKFKIEKSYNLATVLEDLGVKKIFTSIDLSGIVENAPPMYVSSAVHESFIEVNERGTEASGATSFGTSLKSRRKRFLFNRPFAFILREKRLNTILFMGIINKLS